MLVYGKNVALELLKSNTKINKAILSKDSDLLDIIKNKKIKIQFRDKNELDRVYKVNTQGVVLDIEDDFYIDFKEIINKTDFLLILDHIEDPHNFGAIIRTAECAGINYIVIPNKGNAIINSTVMKTSSGALSNIKICKVANLRNAIETLKKNSFWIIGTDSKGEDYTKIDYKGPIALIIGSEGRGLKHIIKSSCDFIASIPLNGKINSLNASVATGIMIYEVLRQRK